MSNSNTNLQTQSSNALHNAIMEAGSKDRPPMLAPATEDETSEILKTFITGIENLIDLKGINLNGNVDDDEDVGAEADINNLDTHIPVSPIPTTKIHKDHPVEQIIGGIYSAP
ncbi:hypothetical protein Tco_0266074 [Tanacetum coccineum]